MAGEITIAKFKDVANGLQPGQFSIGERQNVSGLDGLDPIYRDLLDRPITITLGLIGPDGRVGLTPMWFDYEGDHVLINTAAHRRKCGWIRNNPRLTILVVNPDNPYHWVQLDKIWEKYTGNGPPYGLRDPSIEEKRVLFVCRIDRLATFGKP